MSTHPYNYDNTYEFNGIKIEITQNLFLEAKKFLVDKGNGKYYLNKEKNISIIKKKNKYFIETNEKIYKILKKPKNIIFRNNKLTCSSFILNEFKIFEIIKNLNINNPFYYSKNKRKISLKNHLKTFLKHSYYNEIFENFQLTIINKEKFIELNKVNYNCLVLPKLQVYPERILRWDCSRIILENMVMNSKSIFLFLNKKNNINGIFFVEPCYDLYNSEFPDYHKLYNISQDLIHSTEIEEKYSFFFKDLEIIYSFHITGGFKIGKTLISLYLTSDNNLYLDYSICKKNFDEYIEYFNKSIVRIFDNKYDDYANFIKNLQNELEKNDSYPKNIFFLLSFLIKNINLDKKIVFILDNYSEKNDNELIKFEETIKSVYKKFRLIVIHSLEEKEDKIKMLNKLIKKENNFLYANNLGVSYRDIYLLPDKIKSVIKNFNYSPYYYFNYYDLFEEENLKSNEIINYIEKDIEKEFENKGYLLSLIPCFHLFSDNDLIIKILSQLPIKYFNIYLDDNNKIYVQFPNEIIKQIVEKKIEEKLSNLIINDYSNIFDNQNIIGVAYEIFITKKITNSKKFLNYQNIEIYIVNEIANFIIPNNIRPGKNILIKQKNFNGKRYDLLFLILQGKKYRIILIQISINKTLNQVKQIYKEFPNDINNICLQLKEKKFEFYSKELFFILSPNSPCIKTFKEYLFPFIIYDPKEEKVFSKDNTIINQFPFIEKNNPSFINFTYKLFQSFKPISSNLISSSLLIKEKNNFIY